MKIIDLCQQITDDLFIAKVNNKLYLMSEYHLGDSNFDYGVYDICEVGNSKYLQIPDIYIDDIFNFLQYDDMPNHYDISEEDIEIITNGYYCDWCDKALELGYKDFSETNSYLCDYLKGTLVLDEFTNEELKAFEDIDDYTFECINKFESSIIF